MKPPTVSKDEIDKSGLEIIKASQLPQHEKDGKVASNCLDRVSHFLDQTHQLWLTFYFPDSVSFAWTIMIRTMTSVSCLVAMLSTKDVLTSGYRKAGTTVLPAVPRCVRLVHSMLEPC